MRYIAPIMSGQGRHHWRWLTGLSGRLLALSAAFVMLAEVLVFVPSISRFRLDYLQDRLAKAHLAILALEATPDNMIEKPLERELLLHAGAYTVVLKSPERRMLMLSGGNPPPIDVTFNLRTETFADWIGDALWALIRDRDRVMRVVGPSPQKPDAMIEVVLDEQPMRLEMLQYSGRILALSLIISLITACLVYLSLQWLMVRPIRQITDSILRFRDAPEDAGTAITPADRNDEIGLAQRALAAMQRELRGALHQKTRLAALGSAVAKINHDLKNTLATAMLASDRLSLIDDPEVQRLAPRLLAAIDRAVALCGRTLEYVGSDQPPLHEETFILETVLTEVAASVKPRGDSSGGLDGFDCIGCDVRIEGDRQQLFRVFSNLVLNAQHAGAKSVRTDARLTAGKLIVDMNDDGPGIPADVLSRLFQPFALNTRNGGSGLGLVIAREIITAHGGTLTLLATGESGTTFRIELPERRLRPLSSRESHASPMA